MPVLAVLQSVNFGRFGAGSSVFREPAGFGVSMATVVPVSR